jgi:PmbA protein
MTGQEALAGIVANAGPGEEVEVFARRVASLMVTADPGGRTRTERRRHWQVEVRSAAAGQFAAAMTTNPSPDGIQSTLDTARELRRLAPRPVPEPGALPALPGGSDPAGRTPAGLDRAGPEPDAGGLDRVREAAIAAAPAATVTVASSVASVWLVDSRGRCGCYTSSEAQLAIRSRPPAAGALGASLAPTPDSLDVDAAVAELHRTSACLAAPPGDPVSVAWLALAPLATAQLLSYLASGLIRSHYPDGPPPAGAVLGSDEVRLVDDGTLPGGPASVPFDDEGIPTRRTEIIHKGRLGRLLSGLPLAVSTGNARRGDWRTRTGVAPTNLFLEPAAGADLELSVLAGTGLYVTTWSGVRRSALDLRHSPVELTAYGVTMRGGQPVGRVRGVVSATGRELLGAVAAVAGGTRFYRINGVVGGSECLLAGLPVELVGH